MCDLPPEAGKISDSDESQSHSAKKTAAPTLKMEMGSFYIPKGDPLKPLGEDAHFISADKQTAGVADGVGGWAKQGVDAGDYARDLISNCADAVADATAVYLPTVLHTAFDRTTAVRGSSTVCIVQLDGDVLRSIYVGDSRFMLFRNCKCTYESPVQQYRFNCPYQLGMEPGSNKPDQAECPDVEVMAGDIVVVGTDGLMDNMFVKEIEEVLKAAADTAAPEDLARQVATLAMYNSIDEDFFSPFAVAALSSGEAKIGGKIDDITVIVGRIMAVD